ncbi:TadE family protein [Nocardioides jensenii]|uniref:TadE family protein n=1 Tax=Nocardioides jensenii TaxID=1843 RepID=UPI00082B55F7|nr:TadE family protein [Nocardioides jensenii]
MRQRREGDERGSAVVDFVLVLVILIPLVLGILQLALVLHVRNTLTAAASEGARHGATADRGPADGAAYTRRQIGDIVAGSFAEGVTARETRDHGSATVEVTVRAEVPALGLWGPSVELVVHGHATEEDQ